MASLIPTSFKKAIVDLLISTKEDKWLMLLTSAHAPAASQQFVSQVMGNEVVDPGGIYPAGGVPVPLCTAQPHGINYYLDAPDVSIGPGATLTYRYGILYTKTGGTGQATYKIRAQIDFDPVTELDQQVTNGTTTIQWYGVGIIYVS